MARRAQQDGKTPYGGIDSDSPTVVVGDDNLALSSGYCWRTTIRQQLISSLPSPKRQKSLNDMELIAMTGTVRIRPTYSTMARRAQQKRGNRKVSIERNTKPEYAVVGETLFGNRSTLPSPIMRIMDTYERYNLTNGESVLVGSNPTMRIIHITRTNEDE